MASTTQASLTTVAEFPRALLFGEFGLRADGSILVTAMNKKELWFVPAPGDERPVKAVLMHTFAMMTLFVVETDPDVFLIGCADVYDTQEAQLYRLNLHGWTPGQKVEPRLLLTSPEPKVASTAAA